MSATMMEVDPVERRVTRSALTELPSPSHSVHILSADVRANIIRNTSVSPTTSVDEMLIQQRGRRKMPVTWSPDIDLAKRQGPPAKERTPIKTPLKTTIVLRSTPRKRLLLTDSKETNGSTPEKQMKKTPSPWKKARAERVCALGLDGTQTVPCSPLQTALKGLSPVQLIDVIQNMVEDHPDLEKEIIKSLPMPDLEPLDDKLTYLKGNIFKSLPTSRLTSKTDSPAYSRAATHINAFKKCIVEQGKTLVESQHWNSVIDYALMAWRHVRETPLWDNPPHNAARKHCYHALASMVLHALKRGSWSLTQLENIYASFKRCEEEVRETDSSLRQILAMCKSKLQ